MGGRKPSEPDGKKVFAEAERPIRKRLGNRVCRSACAGFGAVRSKRDASGKKRGKPAPLAGKVGGNAERENGCGGRTDEGVKKIPDSVEERHFVCEKFENVKTDGEAENDGMREDVQFFRQMDDVKALEQAKGGDGGVEIESGGKSGAECKA